MQYKTALFFFLNGLFFVCLCICLYITSVAQLLSSAWHQNFNYTSRATGRDDMRRVTHLRATIHRQLLFIYHFIVYNNSVTSLSQWNSIIRWFTRFDTWCGDVCVHNPCGFVHPPWFCSPDSFCSRDHSLLAWCHVPTWGHVSSRNF